MSWYKNKIFLAVVITTTAVALRVAANALLNLLADESLKSIGLGVDVEQSSKTQQTPQDNAL